MIDYGCFRFACPPGTGASWFIKACQLVGLGPGFNHHTHVRFPESPSNVLKVSLVRHPCDWIVNRYAVLLAGNHSNHVSPFVGLRRESFDAFVLDYLRLSPGAVGKLFDAYQADICMRIEDVPWAFLELMRSLGIKRELAVAVERLHKPFDALTVPMWNPRLRRQVVDAERELLERYDYW